MKFIEIKSGYERLIFPLNKIKKITELPDSDPKCFYLEMSSNTKNIYAIKGSYDTFKHFLEKISDDCGDGIFSFEHWLEFGELSANLSREVFK